MTTTSNADAATPRPTRRIGVAPQDCGDPEVTWLTARAVTLLVILRGGARTFASLARTLGESERSIIDLAVDAASLGIVRTPSHRPCVELTEEGRDWLVRSRSAL